MRTLKRINSTILLVVLCATTMNGQPSDENLKKMWDLVKVEPLASGMGGIGEEMKRLDFRNDTLLVVEEPWTVGYNII